MHVQLETAGRTLDGGHGPGVSVGENLGPGSTSPFSGQRRNWKTEWMKAPSTSLVSDASYAKRYRSG